MSFSEKARTLAEVERKIYCMAKNGAGVSTKPRKKEAPFGILVPIALAVAAFLLSGLVDQESLLRIGCWVLAILALGKAYTNWKYRAIVQESHKRQNAADAVLADLLRQREKLLKELNAEKPAGDGNIYWWEKAVSPVEAAKQNTGMNVSGWSFGIFDEVHIEQKNQGLYCADFVKGITTCSRTYTSKLSENQDFCEIYHDDSAWPGWTEKLICRYLYLYKMEPLTEIEASTTRTRIDKAEEMKKYQRKLDEWERNLNWLNYASYSTNEERYYHGEISDQTSREKAAERGMLEFWEQEKIDKRPDYEEHTVYREKFAGLYDMEFLPCALVLLGEGGRIASVFLLRKMQESLEFTMRADRRKNPHCGYLESYLEFEPLIIGGTRMRPDIQTVADYLFHEKNGLQLKQRNILEPKPDGLTDAEWSYLIWTDH